ncbi:hypothetical protein ABKN59_005177 [Abortiporus biennis]
MAFIKRGYCTGFSIMQTGASLPARNISWELALPHEDPNFCRETLGAAVPPHPHKDPFRTGKSFQSETAIVTTIVHMNKHRGQAGKI